MSSCSSFWRAFTRSVISKANTEMPTIAPCSRIAWNVTFVNITFQALREHGATVGISVFAFEVTELVQARQKLEQLFNDATTT